jgi:hypothetical protein
MMNGSFDIMERRFSVAGSHTAGAVLFIDNLVDETMILEQIIKPYNGLAGRSAELTRKTGLHQVRDMMIAGITSRKFRLWRKLSGASCRVIPFSLWKSFMTKLIS